MEQSLSKLIQSRDPKKRALAIKELATSSKPENLKVLYEIIENEKDPRLQEYAAKAAQHLSSKLNSPEILETASIYQQITEKTKTDQALKNRRSTRNSSSTSGMVKVSKANLQVAERKVQRAIALHLGGQTKKALKHFIQALELNPNLDTNTYMRNIAEELTGLPYQAAFQALKDRSTRNKLLKSANNRPH